MQVIDKIIIGIDASNIRLGGGVTHLREILLNFDPKSSNINRLIIWGSQNTLSKLPVRVWIKKIHIESLDRGLLNRVFWQTTSLCSEARAEQCDILFVLGGSYLGAFRPFVTISQNLLPFEWDEIRRFWPKTSFFKMSLLRLIQAITFQRSQGIIFLSHYSKNKTIQVVDHISSPLTIIPHGLNAKFPKSLSNCKNIRAGTLVDPVQVLYVSNIDVYKHQKSVMLAVKRLVSEGYPIKILFIGPGSKNEIDQFVKFQNKIDPAKSWSSYLGEVPYEDISKYYAAADIGIFASSCETFGITLLEKMAAGLPIACSDRSCMPEILQDGGLYFNPEDPKSIANALERFLLNARLRAEKSTRSIELARNYSWEKCAHDTFAFIEKIARENKK